MQTENTKLLKEWAVVLKAMQAGQQIILFRKGGIIERHHQFEVESPEFFLFPTYLHQSADQLQPRYQSWIAETETLQPGPNKVKLGLYATVEKVLEAKGIERLRTLTDEFVWTPEYIEKAWSWEPEKPAYILFLRVYQLEHPYIVPDRPEYGGCISWVDSSDPLPVRDLVPVLDAETFARRCQAIERVLHDTAVMTA